MSKKIAVVTGGNRGLGFGVCQALAERGYHVILTARSLQKAKQACERLAAASLEVEAAVLDVASEQSVQQFFSFLRASHGRLDVLGNNAGAIFEGKDGAGVGVFDVPAEVLARTFDNNTLGAYRMLQHAVPMMNEAGFGRIVNVSSGMGGLHEMGTGHSGYRLSKTALNALTCLFDNELKGGVKINSVCPGWVRTEMGGEHATRSLDEGVFGIVWAATLDEDGPSGGFFRDGEKIDW